MRSALLGVCFALIVHRGGRATTDEDFRPTPIPLNEWTSDKAASAQGATTHAGPAPAGSPRYWEDALRHSVYLTFVRDRIDQLIARGNALTPDGKLEAQASNDIDDHKLWEKIKAAPFERLDGDELPFKGDIALLAKGRLLDVNGELRFTEDELMKERCDEKCMQGVKALWSVRRVRQKDTDMLHGKYHYELTFSVNSQTPKKIKKPFETPVRTFTVRDGTPVEQPSLLAPHAPRPQRAVWLHRNIVPIRSYSNHNQGQGLDRLFLSLFGSDEEDEPSRPIRPHPYATSVFGAQQVKAGHVGSPTEQYHQKKPHIHSQVYKYSRPPLGPPPTISQAEHHYQESEKLKVPIQHTKVQYHFSDSDGKIKVPLTPPPVQLTQHQVDDKINSIYPIALPQAQAHAPVKLDHPTTDKNYTPIPFSTEVQRYLDEVAAKYPYNPPAAQYPYDATTVQQVEPQHSTANYQHTKELEPVTKNPPYIAQPDYRYQPSNVVKTTRPAVLPTPPIGSVGATKNLNSSETSTKEPEIVTVSTFKSHKKYPVHKLQQMKVSTLHFPDHVRPPVFNAPPGVFAPVDKKPFKPMPPLKYHHQNYHSHSKHVKTRPMDFRPSPQVVDIQLFSEPDPLADAFRPMPVFTKNITYSNESSEEADSERYKSDHHKNIQKIKPMKIEPVKPQPTTTNIPDIITAQSSTLEDGDSMHWANSLLSALAKTYPLESANNKTEITPDEPTTTVTEPITVTVTLPVTTEPNNRTAIKNEEVATTTRTPKRTRPPHKVVKAHKEKKHKRVNTTTTISTTSTTTTKAATERPRHKRPPMSDLTPQASSAASGTPKPSWKPKQKEQNDTTTTTQNTVKEDVVTLRSTTTTLPSTTTKLTTTSKPTSTTILPEIDDQTTPKNMNRFRQSTLFYKGTSVKHDKWSMPVTETNKTKPIHIKPNQQYQRRKGSNFHGYVSSTPKNVDEQHHKAGHKDLAYKTTETTTEMILDVIPATKGPIQLVENIEEDIEDSSEDDEEEEDSNEKKGTWKDVVVFYNESNLPQDNDEESKSIEVEEHNITKDTTPATVKKSKCKKKKHQNLTTTEETLPNESYEVVGVEKVTTEKATLTTETDLLTHIFGGYTVEGLPTINKTIDAVAAGSERQEQVAELKDDLEDFLDSLEEKKSDNSYEYEDEEDNDDDDDELSSQDSKVNEKRSQRQAHPDISYDEYRERPYSLLELMAME